jgi:hypothetical protein
MYAPMAIIGAVGLYYVSQNASRRVILGIFVLLAFGYPTTMVVAEKATLDSPAFDDEYPRYAHTSTEIAAVDTVSEIHSPATTEVLRTDHPYKAVWERYGGYRTQTVVVGDDGPTTSAPTVARDYQATAPAIVRQSGEPPIDRRSNAFAGTASICPDDRNHVYGNTDVTVCTATPVTSGGGS